MSKLKEIQAELDPSEVGMFNMQISSVYKRNYNRKDIDPQLHQDIHFFLGICFQGRYDEFLTAVEDIKEGYLYHSNLNKLAKNFLNKYLDKLELACQIYLDIYDVKIRRGHPEYDPNLSISEMRDAVARSNENYMSIFQLINSFDLEEILTS